MPLTRRKSRVPVVDVTFGDLYNDPYPVYRQLRRKAPVAVAPALAGFWLVSRFEDVKTVLSDDELFSSDFDNVLPQTLRSNVLFCDGAEHARHRAAYQPSFTPRASRDLAEAVTAEVAGGIIDAWPDGRSVELVERFCEPVAVGVGARLLGLEQISSVDLARWYDHIACHFTIESPLETRRIAEHTNEEIDAFLGPHLAALARAPDGSPLSRGFPRGDDAPVLSEAERLADAKVLLFAGIQELRDLLGHLLLALLQHPGALAKVRVDPSLLAAAVEEAARWSSPVGVVPRIARRDTELAGKPVPAGARLAVAIGSANRDERRWTNPDVFDLARDEGMHLAFATGVHFCLGAWLARSVAPLAVGRLLERVPGLGLQPGESPVTLGWTFRGVRRLVAERG